MWSHWSRLAQGDLHIYFLDVGQGDAVLIKTPSDQIILVDGGPGTEILTELNDILPFLKKDIDLMVLTHPHADHIEGLVAVLKRYDVESALVTGVQYNNAYYDEFLRDLRDEAKVYFAYSGMDFDFGDGVFLDTLYPFELIVGEEFENVNNSSIVMRITYEDVAILLSGDAEVEIEEMLLGSEVEADLMKASHHGSRTANSEEFLEAVSPEVVVIQVGKDNQFDHPHEETLKNLEGIDVYRNDLHGTVEIVF